MNFTIDHIAPILYYTATAIFSYEWNSNIKKYSNDITDNDQR